MTDSRSPELLWIGDRKVGPDEPCLIVAEAGVNHNGDVDLAHRLIEVAADCGADAVKFQTFEPQLLVVNSSEAAPYQRQQGATSQREMLQALALPVSGWSELASHATERRLIFLSTAFDVPSLDLIVGLGVQVLKVPSGELDNLGFIAEVACRGLPLIISTGLGTLEEVRAACASAKAAPGIALLHCVSAYPAPIEASNLRVLPTMAELFEVPVGWSDHTEGYVTAVTAIALGAKILEKHVTLDRGLSGPDHVASADPRQFAAYVEAVRAAESSLGDGVKRPVVAEIENRAFARRSHHAVRNLSPGDVVTQEDVCLLRPATGLPPSANVVGRVIARPVRAGQPITAEDLR